MSSESSTERVRLRPPQNPVEPRAKTWWRLQILIALAIAGAVLGFVGLMLASSPWWFWLVTIVVAVAGLITLVAMPVWWYKVHRWEVTETAVYTRTGYFWQEWRAAPMSRIQTVDVDRGPLEQVLKLGTLTVTTASAKGALQIKGLDHEDAAELAEQLTQVAQSVEGDAT